jgi:hypothetical protein
MSRGMLVVGMCHPSKLPVSPAGYNGTDIYGAQRRDRHFTPTTGQTLHQSLPNLAFASDFGLQVSTSIGKCLSPRDSPGFPWESVCPSEYILSRNGVSDKPGAIHCENNDRVCVPMLLRQLKIPGFTHSELYGQCCHRHGVFQSRG